MLFSQFQHGPGGGVPHLDILAAPVEVSTQPVERNLMGGTVGQVTVYVIAGDFFLIPSCPLSRLRPLLAGPRQRGEGRGGSRHSLYSPSPCAPL